MLKAKLHAPPIHKNIVSRNKVLTKLQHAQKCKLTLVTAPAGYGKTTAVLDWLGKCGLPSAWLSLDAEDNNPVTFWRYVCAVLDGIDEGIGKDTEYVFSSLEMIKANVHIHIFIDRLSEVPFDFLFVLDDLHLINDPSILAGLSYLIDYLPVKMHMVFIGRTEPMIELPRHRVKWQVQRLTEEDLRFDEGEIYDFYRMRGIALDNTDLKEIENYTEGWAAALVAVILSMEEDNGCLDNLKMLSHASRDIERYLRIEVLGTWPEEKRLFAMKTSILSSLSEPLCEELTGDSKAGGILKEIHEGNGFLAAVDDQNHVYRYHQLFRSLLYKLLLEYDPAVLADLHRKAACWYREHGFQSEAVDHLLDGGLFREACEVIEYEVDHLIHRNDFGTLLSWIGRIPAEYQDKSFKIAMIYALYYAETGRYEVSRQWVGRMKALEDSNSNVSGPELSKYFRTAVTLVEANLLIREGNMDYLPLLYEAAETTGRTYRMPEYNDFNTADIYFSRCPINALTRLINEDWDKYNKMAEIYRGMITKNPGYAPLCVGECYYESNRLDGAIPYLLKAAEESMGSGCPGALVPAMVNVARVKRAQGDMEGAFSVIDECEKHLRYYNKAHWSYLTQAFRCRLFLDTGDREKVRRWQASRKLNLFAEINKINEFELIVFSRALILSDRMNDARLLLQRLLSFTGDNRRLHSRVEVLNLLALLAFQKNSTSVAFRFLDESLDIGMKEGFVRSFLDELSPMARMLRSYQKSRWKLPEDSKERRAYAGNILKQMPESLMQTLEAHDSVTKDAAERIFGQLTAQEKKVLELMADAATNQEIGEKLGISLRTVKAHTGNIYGKLGLKNRAQCTKLVRELGLL